ncbi:MAG: hypothetical protein CVV64_04775 [Candidatus Wallbacteria bacterium HGW-Wallbacteria-1]|jgi:ribosomal peptide maturation radical SAM protein 1|uniref:Radical SAM core domain-containing protein n=1 Tax=Candidatus Wallbacteria bacterium HGW-Wallbacteria-1 TaxID=2013854 RepID=A0A2N1PRX2_9BACT|nr:MAG: hypothetical protein CVV64_04775 [Candidatus Wallbacteria bacterium HGW-Wallbacteria-1]
MMIKLINMPFASVLKPSLGLGQIQAQLKADEIDVETLNFNVEFGRLIGFANYEFINLIRRYETQIGEWLFADAAWGEGFIENPDEVLDQVCSESLQLHRIADPKSWFMDIRERIVPQFMEYCIETLFQDGIPEIIGFSSLYFQNIASFALARRVREIAPQVKIVFGGPNFHGEMGIEYIEKLPFIDVVCLGEADDTALPLFRALLQNMPPVGLQGIMYRDEAGAIILSAPPQPVSSEVINSVPHPDFTDYFRQIAQGGLMDDAGWKKCCYIPFESSRGCWKGDRQHCAFCGLNHQGMGFRQKDSSKVMEILRHYCDKYPVRRFHATDNIIPQQYFSQLLNRLKNEPLPEDVRVFWEVRSTLKRDDLRAFAEAGITILQPGIESLSTSLLNAMRKGVSALKNVHFLKVCRNFGIHVIWNLMTGIPGEKKEDYDEMCRLIPMIVHLAPPFGGPRIIEMHKFSPYYFESVRDEKWAANVRAKAWYRTIYPEKLLDLDRIAYFFDADWKDVLPSDAYAELDRKISAWIDIWQKSPRLPVLNWRNADNGRIVIMDTRSLTRTGTWELDSLETSVYRAIDDPASPLGITRTIGLSDDQVSRVEAILHSFVSSGIAIREKNTYLGLALPEGIVEPDFHWRNGELRIRISDMYEIL